MGKRSVANNNNSSNVLSQQKILEDLNQLTKNDLKPQANSNKKGPKKNKRQQQQQQQQQKVQEPETQPQQQKQKSKKNQPKVKKPDTSVRNTYKLLSNWEFYTNSDWKNNTKANINNIQTFANKGNIRSQLDKVQEIQVKFTYKPEKSKSSELKNSNKKRLRELTKAPPGVHEYRMKQFLQELNNKRQQKEIHDRVTNLLVKRYTQKMNTFADEYQKAYKVYQESIKENLGVAEIKNSQINAQKTFSHQKRLQKKAKLQKKMFRSQRKRILESHTSPANWTEANEKLFQTAIQKILIPSYDGFHFFGRQEYNRDLAWVEANENTTHKQSISVATIMACQNSPIPGETRLSQNRVPTVAPSQQKKSGNNKEQPQQQKQKKQQTPKEKPMTIKIQTPEQYRERITGKKAKKTVKNDEPNDGNRKKGGKSSPIKMEKTSPSIVNPGPATWVTETELPDTFAWGILQHQPGNGKNGGRSGNRNGGKKNKDEALNMLFPKSAPNQGGNANKQQPKQNGNNNGRKQQNRKQRGININEII